MSIKLKDKAIIDSDKLDGKDSSQFASNSHTHTVNNITDMRIKNGDSMTTGAPGASWANSSIKNNAIAFGGNYIGHSTTDANIVFASSNGAVNMVIDGEYYAKEGQYKVYHAGNKPTKADVGLSKTVDRTTTISSASPSGGANGDIWFKYV